jgi:hypothetical protein
LENIFQPNTTESTEVLPDVIWQDSVKIPLTSPAEVKREIKMNINPKMFTGFDLITGKILKEIPRNPW